MRKIKAEYLTSGIFLCVIIVFMSCIPFIYVMNKIEWRNKTDESIDSKFFDKLKALYPFDENKEEYHEQKDSLFEYVKKWCELYTNEYIALRYSILETAGALEKAVKWNIAPVFDYNAVVKMPDDHLTVYSPSLDITADAKATAELAEFCRQRGIDFFYVNAPTKVCAIDDKNISGILDFKNQNTDRFLDVLSASGVKYYDLRKNLHEDGMNHHKSFYITDNHWRLETALWAAKHILEFLRDDYGWPVKPEMLNPDKFNFDVYHEWFLGGHGTKATLAKTKPEDFTFVYPKYETGIKLYEPDGINYTSGDFFVMCNMNELEEKDYYGKHTYNGMYKSPSCFRIENNFIRNGKKILMVRDSFATGLLPFMILGTQSIDAIDLRTFPGSLRSYIKANHPDILIIMYCSDIPGGSSMKNASEWNTRPFDFR